MKLFHVIPLVLSLLAPTAALAAEGTKSAPKENVGASHRSSNAKAKKASKKKASKSKSKAKSRKASKSKPAKKTSAPKDT
jgi:hypothetical protein